MPKKKEKIDSSAKRLVMYVYILKLTFVQMHTRMCAKTHSHI